MTTTIRTTVDRVKAQSAPTLASWRNRHRDGRAFILGCGPSLSRIPEPTLRLLAYDPLTIACNYLWRWPGLSFRPTLWAMSEWDHVEPVDRGLRALEREKSWLPVPRFVAGPDLEGHYERHMPAPYFDNWTLVERDMSKPICQGYVGGFDGGLRTATGGGVVFECAVQLAAWMGCRDIFLLGVDAEDTGYVYSTETGVGASLRKEIPRVAECLAESLLPHGIGLYNATPGGRLDSIPRVDLKDVLNA